MVPPHCIHSDAGHHREIDGPDIDGDGRKEEEDGDPDAPIQMSALPVRLLMRFLLVGRRKVRLFVCFVAMVVHGIAPSACKPDASLACCA